MSGRTYQGTRRFRLVNSEGIAQVIDLLRDEDMIVMDGDLNAVCLKLSVDYGVLAPVGVDVLQHALRTHVAQRVAEALENPPAVAQRRGR